MKASFVSLLLVFGVSIACANPPEPPGGGGGGGFQPGGGGNQPEPPGGGGATFTFDTFLTDSTISGGCIVYGDLMTGCVAGQTLVTIPSAVTKIADGVLAGNTGVTTVDASAATGLVAIPDSFAAGCDGLVAVALPATATTVGASAFAMDSELVSFTGMGVMTVGDYAFFGCTSLVVSATATYETMGESAFAGVSYVDETGAVYASEAAPLVTWIKAGGAVVSSLATRPTTCNTEDLKAWLTNDVANLEAYLYADAIATNENFTVLSVSGAKFLFTAQDLTTFSVAHADLQVSTDLENWATVSQDDIVDSVYTLPTTTNGFARVVYSLTW